MVISPLLAELVEALRCLPGVGPKSAQRMALHILERDRDGAKRLGRALDVSLDRIGKCLECRMFTESERCGTCSSSSRDRSVICIVETPADVLAIEQGTDFRGLYFVLMGRLSPLDGIGPGELGLDLLDTRLSSGEISELILATNPTVEGEATAHFVAQMATRRQISVTRIAQGVPMGGELEFVDSSTLAHALSSRNKI